MLTRSINSDDHLARPSSVCLGDVSVVEYRRGLDEKKYQHTWQKLWHFNERCEHYPTRNFMTRTDRPPDDELCARCNNSA
jgi:hypothetical protein